MNMVNVVEVSPPFLKGPEHRYCLPPVQYLHREGLVYD